MELLTTDYRTFSLAERLELAVENWARALAGFFRAAGVFEPSRAGEKWEPAGKVWQTAHTSETLDTPVKHHTWSQIILVPVEIVPDPKDGEPVLFFDKEEYYRLATEDPRVGCLVCSMSLDEGWDTPCEGEQNGSQDVLPL